LLIENSFLSEIHPEVNYNRPFFSGGRFPKSVTCMPHNALLTKGRTNQLGAAAERVLSESGHLVPHSLATKI
jgi:hypothetical protein